MNEDQKTNRLLFGVLAVIFLFVLVVLVWIFATSSGM